MTFSCGKCKQDKSSLAFYPNFKTGSWCKECIIRRRKAFPEIYRRKSQLAQLEQENILTVISGFQHAGESLVYLLLSASKYKIGHSKDLRKRIQAFNTASPVPCKIIAVAPGGKQLEQQLHTEFKSLRTFGEWFTASPQILDTFSQLSGAMTFLSGRVTEEAPRRPAFMGS